MSVSYKSLTKPALLALLATRDEELVSRGRDLEALRHEVSTTRADLARARTFAVLDDEDLHSHQPAPRPAFVRRAPAPLPSYMLAARAMAIATGRCVTVGA